MNRNIITSRVLRPTTSLILAPLLTMGILDSNMLSTNSSNASQPSHSLDGKAHSYTLSPTRRAIRPTARMNLVSDFDVSPTRRWKPPTVARGPTSPSKVISAVSPMSSPVKRAVAPSSPTSIAEKLVEPKSPITPKAPSRKTKQSSLETSDDQSRTVLVTPKSSLASTFKTSKKSKNSPETPKPEKKAKSSKKDRATDKTGSPKEKSLANEVPEKRTHKLAPSPDTYKVDISDELRRIEELEQKLKDIEKSKKKELKDIKQNTKKAMKEMYEKLEDEAVETMEAGCSTSKKLQENKALMLQLKRENQKIRERNIELGNNIDKLKTNNERLAEATQQSKDYFERLQVHHKRCVDENMKLQAASETSAAKVAELKSEIENKTQMAQCEHKIRHKSEQFLNLMFEMANNASGDNAELLYAMKERMDLLRVHEKSITSPVRQKQHQPLPSKWDSPKNKLSPNSKKKRKPVVPFSFDK